MLKGIDIGGTFVKVLWEDGRKQKYPLGELKDDKEKYLERLSEIIAEGSPEGVGIAVAGFTSKEGVVSYSPNIQVLNGVNIRAICAERNIECVVGNDVTVGAFGEWYHDHRDSQVLVFVAVGTGLGGGLVIGGVPYDGVSGTAMEIGHHTIVVNGWECNCGRKGCWEAYCSSYGLVKMYTSIGGENTRDYEIIERAKKGEETALRAVEEFKKYLTVGLMNLVHILNPDRIVLGGGVIEGMGDLIGDIEERVKKVSQDLPGSAVRISLSKAGEFAGARGALALIKQRIADS